MAGTRNRGRRASYLDRDFCGGANQGVAAQRPIRVPGRGVSAGIVAALKVITNIDCPWDLADFGGDRPYIELFASRPAILPHAACFPGAHAASGFALVFGYFLLRDRAPRGARWALLIALFVGVAFSSDRKPEARISCRMI